MWGEGLGQKRLSHTQNLQAQRNWEEPSENFLYKTETSKLNRCSNNTKASATLLQPQRGNTKVKEQ